MATRNTRWRDINARCPYYVRSSALFITCSKNLMAEKREDVRRRFRSDEQCEEHFRAYCARRYSACIIYQLIDKILGGGSP